VDITEIAAATDAAPTINDRANAGASGS